MIRRKIAYWVNGLGEEMSSAVHAEFTHGDEDFAVVHDWREGTRGHGFVVLPAKECLIRMETPR